MQHRASSPIALASCALVLLCACDAGPGRVEGRLAECGLVSEGAVGARVTRELHQPDACYRDCLASASCDQLEDTLCGATIDLLRACDERCAYRCDDGALISHDNVCDGIEQCESGQDEEGCPTFECPGGEVRIPSRAVCNGTPQCPDGADESPERCVVCDSPSGTPLLRWSVGFCDGFEHCADGIDERDCERFECDDGRAVVTPRGVSARCDGWTQCPDGSDERDCADLRVTCGT